MKKNNCRQEFVLPQELKDKANKKCNKYNIKISELLRTALRGFVNENPDEEIQKQKIAAFDRLRFHKLLQKEVLYQNARQLRMIGRNLNQITKRINIITNTSITQPVVNEFLDLKKELLDLKAQIIKEIEKLNKAREEIN